MEPKIIGVRGYKHLAPNGAKPTLATHGMTILDAHVAARHARMTILDAQVTTRHAPITILDPPAAARHPRMTILDAQVAACHARMTILDAQVGCASPTDDDARRSAETVNRSSLR